MAEEKDLNVGIGYDEQGLEKSAKRIKKKVKKNAKDIDKLIGEVEIDLELDEKGLKKQVKISAKTLQTLKDKNIDINASTNQLLRAVGKANGSLDSVQDKTVQVDADISEAIGNLGEVDGATKALKDKDINITANGSKAISEINEINGELKSLDTSTKLVITADASNAIKSADKAKQALGNIKSKSVDVGASGGGDGGGGGGMDGVKATGIAVASASVLAIDDLNGAQNYLRATTGKTGEELDVLMKTVKELGSQGMGSFGEIAFAVANVKQGFKTLDGKELEQASKMALNMSSLMGVDVAEAVMSASQLSKDHGLTHKQAMGMIIKGTQDGLNVSGDYLGTLSEFSPQLKEMGLSADQFYNILKAGSEQGIFNTALIGDGLKEFRLLTSATLSDDQIDIMEQMGMNPEKFKEDMRKGGDVAVKAQQDLMNRISKINSADKKNDAGILFFGTMYEDTAGKILPAVQQGLSASTSENFTNNDLASEDVLQTNDTFASTMGGAWNDLKVEMAPLGVELLRLAKEIMPSLITVAGALADAFNSMPDGVKTGLVTGIVALITVIPVIVTLISWIMKIVNVVKWLIPLFQWIGAAIATIAGGLSLPFILIGAAIVALIALIIWKWDEIKAFFVASGEFLGKFFKDFGKFMAEMFVAIFDGIGKGFTWLLEKGTAFKDAIISTFVTFFSTIFNAALNFWKSVGGFFVNLKNDAVGSVMALKDRALGIFGTLKDSVVTRFNSIKDAIINPIKQAKNWVLDAIEGIKKAFSNLSIKIPGISLPSVFGGGGSDKSDSKKGEGGKKPKKVNWFADGGIATSAGLVGVGEAGDEAIVPLTNSQKLRPMTKQMSKDIIGMTEGRTGKSTTSTGKIVNENHFAVYLDSEQISSGMVRPVMEKMRKEESDSFALSGGY